MSQSNRRSFYFNEENVDLFRFLQTKKRANEWVMKLIRQGMVEELGGNCQPPQVTSTPTIDWQQLMNQINRLEEKVHAQSALLSTQATTPSSVPEMIEPVSISVPQPVASTPKPTIGQSPLKTRAIQIEPSPIKPPQPESFDPFGDLGNL